MITFDTIDGWQIIKYSTTGYYKAYKRFYAGTGYPLPAVNSKIRLPIISIDKTNGLYHNYKVCLSVESTSLSRTAYSFPEEDGFKITYDTVGTVSLIVSIFVKYS